VSERPLVVEQIGLPLIEEVMHDRPTRLVKASGEGVVRLLLVPGPKLFGRRVVSVLEVLVVGRVMTDFHRAGLVVVAQRFEVIGDSFCEPARL
jgi:hypothetical protein